MNAQTVGWLIFLALIKKSSCDERIYVELQESQLGAKEGSCVEIKYIIKHKIDGGYWFWIKNRIWIDKDYHGTIIYSSDRSKLPVSPDFADRVQNISSPSSHSILICDLNKTDSGNYSFRFVRNAVKWSSKEVILTVEENPCLIVFEKPRVGKENKTMTLVCSTLSSCPSNPEIGDLSSKLTSESRQIDVHKHKTTVTFTANWKDDGKEFSCQMQNNADKYLVQNISLTVEYDPKNTSAMISTEIVKEGQSVTLTCFAKGQPEPTYTWFKTEKMQFSQVDDKSKWMIKSIKVSQSGEYHCEAQNKLGKTKSNPIIINVTYAPNVEIKMTPPKSTIRQGDEMTLTCNVKRSNPQPSHYIWFKDSTFISWGQTYDIQGITPEDSGTYTCKANNTVDTGTSQPFQVKVEYRPWKTNISIPGFHKSVKVGHSLTFTCNTEANPVPHTYLWYRYSKNEQTSQWMLKTNSLHLKSVQRADEACYICNATNSIGTGDSSWPLCIQVLYPPTNITLSMDYEVTEGQLITISCAVESFPLSRLTLTRTSTSNAQPSEWNITKQADVWYHNTFSHTFHVTSTHAGFYICYANNSEGSKKSTERKLVVKYTPQKVTVKAQPNLVVNESTSLMLDCSALSHPLVTSVTWMKMIDGKDVIVHRNQSLILKSVTPSDSGQYSCTATNEIGSGKSQSVKVEVKYAPKHTKITRVAEQQSNGVMRAVTLSCSSDCNPPVKQYTWYMKKDGDQEYRKVLYHQNHTVYSDKPGFYYCIAENEIDQGKSDTVEMFLDSDFTKVLIISLILVLLIIFIITIVCVNRYRKNKSIQQGTLNRLPWWNCFSVLAWRSGDSRRNLMSQPGLAEPFRSREDLLPDQPRRPNAQPCQPHPDRTAASNINSVYCTVNLPGKQGPSAQKPNSKQGGQMEEDALNYASLHFGNKQKQSRTEEDMYAMVSKPRPPKKNKQETMEPYENMSTAHAAKSPNPLNYDTDTSEDEGELNYSQVTFNPKLGHQRANTDSSSSDEEYETQYSEVKI